MNAKYLKELALVYHPILEQREWNNCLNVIINAATRGETNCVVYIRSEHTLFIKQQLIQNGYIVRNNDEHNQDVVEDNAAISFKVDWSNAP